MHIPPTEVRSPPRLPAFLPQGLLDLVESEVLAPLRISSLRIDGGVETTERFRRWAGAPGRHLVLVSEAGQCGKGGELVAARRAHRA